MTPESSACGNLQKIWPFVFDITETSLYSDIPINTNLSGG